MDVVGQVLADLGDDACDLLDAAVGLHRTLDERSLAAKQVAAAERCTAADSSSSRK